MSDCEKKSKHDMLKVRYLPIGIALVNSRSKKGGNNSNLYGYFIGTVSIMKSAEI